MTKEDIKRMAIEAGWDAHQSDFDTRIKTFAALVASAERNRCVAKADIALLGADMTLRDRVLKAINITSQA